MSVTAAASSHHVIILLQNNIFIIIKVQQVNGKQLVGHAAWRLDTSDQLQGVDDGLDGSMVGRPHVLTQREGAGPLAVIGVIAPGGHDPPRPADLLEVHIQRQPLAGIGPAIFHTVVQRASGAGGFDKCWGLG